MDDGDNESNSDADLRIKSFKTGFINKISGKAFGAAAYQLSPQSTFHIRLFDSKYR